MLLGINWASLLEDKIGNRSVTYAHPCELLSQTLNHSNNKNLDDNQP